MFIGASYCSGIPKSSNPDILSYGQKVALITELALAALVVAAGVMAILASNGVPLNQLSSFGALGTQNGLIMMGVGLGVFIVDMIAMMIQYKIKVRRCNTNHSGVGQLKAAAGKPGATVDTSDKDAQIIKLQGTITDQGTTLRKWKGDLKDARAQVTTKETSLVELQRRLGEQASISKDLQEKLAKQVQALQDKEAALDALKKQNKDHAPDAANQEIASLKVQLGISNSHVKGQETKIAELQAEIQTLQTTNFDLQGQIEEYEALPSADLHSESGEEDEVDGAPETEGAEADEGETGDGDAGSVDLATNTNNVDKTEKSDVDQTPADGSVPAAAGSTDGTGNT